MRIAPKYTCTELPLSEKRKQIKSSIMLVDKTYVSKAAAVAAEAVLLT